ncbi:succinate dehydrogenase assembly factor 2 [Marinicellulosiphila megalodicopiae]|uniref:FAD assembly factor SdhE n=1 Tax=Marinicellulosiphila megalodicopiae TaxID=2724896 RepID=UPI003BAEEA07
MVAQEKLNKLFWHSRRGMLELDLLLVPFVQEHYAHIDEINQARYDALITEEDQDLFAWLMKRDPATTDEHQIIINLILEKMNVK